MRPAKEKRRILAVVLPQLLGELAAQQTAPKTQKSGSAEGLFRGRSAPSGVWGVSLRDTPHSTLQEPIAFSVQGQSLSPEGSSEQLEGKTLLDAVSSEARRYGVRPGQSLIEARAIVAHLHVYEVSKADVQTALERICESVMRFGATVAYESPDTIWVDITGVSHLFGGEQALAQELTETLQGQGYSVRVAVSSGPILAQAFARWSVFPSKSRVRVVQGEETRREVQCLPISALPIEADVKTWLAQLGVLTFADLVKIPAEHATSRLGLGGGTAFALAAGEDEQPLKAFVPVELPVEVNTWEEPVTGSEPLLFALRGLTARLAERLEGRGLAAQSMKLTIAFDPAIARFRGCSKTLEQEYELAAPLFRSEEIWKVISSRLSRTPLPAPSLGLQLQVLSLTSAHQRQLDLSSVQSKLDAANPEALAVLFGELAADVGSQQFGLLRACDSHRPEKVSLLEPVNAKQFLSARGRRSRKKSRKLPAPDSPGALPIPSKPSQLELVSRSKMTALEFSESQQLSSKALALAPKPHPSQDEVLLTGQYPSRVFKSPIPLGAPIRAGTLVPIGSKLFSIKQAKFERRLQSVEWWSGAPVNRDYVRVWLEHEQMGVEALLFVDKNTGQRFIQGVFD